MPRTLRPLSSGYYQRFMLMTVSKVITVGDEMLETVINMKR